MAPQEARHIALFNCAAREATPRVVYDSEHEHDQKAGGEVAVGSLRSTARSPGTILSYPLHGAPEGTLKGGASVHQLAVRDEHLLERKL